MEIYLQARINLKAVELLKFEKPELYEEFLDQSKLCEIFSDHKIIIKLHDLQWNLDKYLEKEVPNDEIRKYKAILALNQLIPKCFYELSNIQKKVCSENENLFISLIDVLKDLESNNKQRLNWVRGELLSKASTFEREFLDILFSSSYNIKTIFEYFNTRFENKSSFDLALGSLNEFLKLHLGIITRKAEYDQYDKARLESAQYNSWGKECRNIPPPQNRS
jgi:hypothetical protein